MISPTKMVTKFILDSWEHKIYILCIALVGIFTVNQYADMEYSAMFIESFTNNNFLVVMLYPIFALLSYQVFKYINSNYNILLRIPDRTALLKIYIRSIITISFIVFLESIIIFFILCNITPHQSFSLTKVYEYNTFDIIVIIVSIIKVYLTIVSISLLSITLNFFFFKNNISLFTTVLFIVSMFFTPRYIIANNIFTTILNPGYHSSGFTFTSDIFYLIISGIFYFTVVYFILFSLAKRFIKIKDISV